jgi:hypothetical protein
MALRRDDSGSNTAIERPRRHRVYSVRSGSRCPTSVSTLGRVSDEVRVSDADREDVVRRLRRAVGEGRLDMVEFEERAAIAYAARTRVELDPLTSDLPRDLW